MGDADAEDGDVTFDASAVSAGIAEDKGSDASLSFSAKAPACSNSSSAGKPAAGKPSGGLYRLSILTTYQMSLRAARLASSVPPTHQFRTMRTSRLQTKKTHLEHLDRP